MSEIVKLVLKHALTLEIVLNEDTWINDQASYVPLRLTLLQSSALTGGHSTHDISQLEGCAIAVDATYYLSQLLETPPAHEPLLSALGGLTGVESHISQNLDEWAKSDVVPFFVFDGQPVTGQDDITLDRGLKANKKTDEAWNLYFQGAAEEAVSTFGTSTGE